MGPRAGEWPGQSPCPGMSLVTGDSSGGRWQVPRGACRLGPTLPCLWTRLPLPWLYAFKKVIKNARRASTPEMLVVAVSTMAGFCVFPPARSF